MQAKFKLRVKITCIHVYVGRMNTPTKSMLSPVYDEFALINAIVLNLWKLSTQCSHGIKTQKYASFT